VLSIPYTLQKGKHLKSVLLVIPPARYADLKPEITGWLFDRTVEGWQASVHTTSAASGYDLRAELGLLAPFNFLFMLGDLPTIQVFLSPDGHEARWLSAIAYMASRNVSIDNARVPGTDQCSVPAVIGDQPYAHVGWLKYEGLAGLTDADVLDQYRRWFARRHDYSLHGASAFTVQSLDLDHFDKVNFGRVVESMFAKFPKSFTWFMPTAPNGSDGEIFKQQPALTYTVMSGGFNFGDGQYLDYWGRYLDLQQYPMQTPFPSFYGSHTCEWTYNQGSIVRAALLDMPGASLGAKAINSVYNHAGDFRFDIVLNGGTFGEAATATNGSIGYPLGILCGDPTVTLDAATVARLAANELEAEVTPQDVQAMLVPLQQQITDLSNKIAPLLAGTGGGGTTDTGTAITILSAKYRQVASPTTFKDATAVVQALVTAGKPFFVYSDAGVNGNGPCLSDPSWGVNPKDPYPGVLKELVVTYSKGGGAAQTVVFGQFAAVTF